MYLKYLIFLSIFYLFTGKRLFSTLHNYNKPSCIECKFYIPDDFSEYSSIISKCEKFGHKDINNGKIYNDYSNSCRKDETKCGINGKEFEKVNNLFFCKLKHNFKRFYYLYSVYIISFIILYNKK